MTCVETVCPKCGTKYLRGVFDGGCPKCSMFNSKSWEAMDVLDASFAFYIAVFFTIILVLL